MARKPVKKQKENLTGWTGDGKQSEGIIGGTVDSDKFELCNAITRRS